MYKMEDGMVTCTRKLHWCMGHRLLNHEGKCAMLHGHNYRAEITAEGYEHEVTTTGVKVFKAGVIDEIGRVVDFSVLKSVYDPWIQQYWDHGFVLHKEDYGAISSIRHFEEHTKNTSQKFFLMEQNPTAENIAKFLLLEPIFVQALAQYNVRVCKVVVHETDNCFATVEI